MNDNKFKAKAPAEIKVGYLTPNKEYDVINNSDTLFNIICDGGDKIYCLWNNCSHLSGKNWKKIENNMKEYKITEEQIKEAHNHE